MLRKGPYNFLDINYANTFLQRCICIILKQRFIHIQFLAEIFIIIRFKLNKKKSLSNG